MALGVLMNKAKEASAGAANGVKEKASEIMKSSLAEIKGLEPVLKSCGFIIGDLKLTMSIPPGITIVVEQTDVSQDGLNELVAKEGELSKIQSSIVKGLKDAYSMEDAVNKYGMTIGQVEMELTFPPKVHVHLNSQQSRAFG